MFRDETTNSGIDDVEEIQRSEMKVALIRGEFLNKWEMQNFEPLVEWADVTAFGGTLSSFSLDTLQIPVKRLLSIDPYVNRSRVLRGSVGWGMGRTIGRQFLIGLEDALEAYDIAHTAETFHGFAYQAVQAKRRHRMKVVTTCYETIPFLHEEETPMRRHKFYVQQRADIFLAMSHRAADALRIEGMRRSTYSSAFPRN